MKITCLEREIICVLLGLIGVVQSTMNVISIVRNGISVGTDELVALSMTTNSGGRMREKTGETWRQGGAGG